MIGQTCSEDGQERERERVSGCNVTRCYKHFANQDYVTRFYWFILSGFDAEDALVCVCGN